MPKLKIINKNKSSVKANEDVIYLPEEFHLELGIYKTKKFVKKEDFERAIASFIAQENFKN